MLAIVDLVKIKEAGQHMTDRPWNVKPKTTFTQFFYILIRVNYLAFSSTLW